MVGRANGVIYASRLARGRRRDFFAWRFPAAVWQSGPLRGGERGAAAGAGLVVGAWMATSDEALEAAAPEALREAYLNEDFEAYYSSEPASQFATEVTVNNIQVAFLAFAAGVLLACRRLLLVLNGANLGWPPGCSPTLGELGKFFGLILPHGLLELTAGGHRRRRRAAPRAGRSSPPATARAARPWPTRAARRRDRTRPRARLRGGGPDRGLRHRQRPAHRPAGRHRRGRRVPCSWSGSSC